MDPESIPHFSSCVFKRKQLLMKYKPGLKKTQMQMEWIFSLVDGKHGCRAGHTTTRLTGKLAKIKKGGYSQKQSQHEPSFLGMAVFTEPLWFSHSLSLTHTHIFLLLYLEDLKWSRFIHQPITNCKLLKNSGISKMPYTLNFTHKHMAALCTHQHNL